MNIGFFGLQFSFGLQQANMGPIYGYLGADEASMPLLWLAGPMTGLIIQPIVGAMSDRTNSRLGRRTPYFLVGALICTLSLFAMPYSSTLWMAASLLWILDAATTSPWSLIVPMSPTGWRAINDRPDFWCRARLPALPRRLSYLAPSLLTGLVARDALDANGIPNVSFA